MNKMNSLSLAFALISLTLIFGSVTTSVRAQNEKPQKFKVGLFRADGTIVPFAEYRNGLWWNPWPEPVPQQPSNDEIIPKSLGGQPEPWFRQYRGESSTWYFRSAADTRIVLKAQKLLQIENHSQTNWAIMTDYRQKQTAGKDYHHSQIGMALDVDLKVDGMVEVETGSKEARDIISFIKPIFSNVETEEIARHTEAGVLKELNGFPASAEEREKVELTITGLDRSRFSVSGRQIYYIGIEKQYPRKGGTSPNSFSCENVSFLYGWVLRRKDGALALLNDRSGLTDCDGKERGSSVVMFSVMTLGERTFLFTVEHGWEDESYIIYELNDFHLTPLLETFGG